VSRTRQVSVASTGALEKASGTGSPLTFNRGNTRSHGRVAKAPHWALWTGGIRLPPDDDVEKSLHTSSTMIYCAYSLTGGKRHGNSEAPLTYLTVAVSHERRLLLSQGTSVV
jgi:hypothetical protein